MEAIMRRTFFALLVAGVSVAIMDARPDAQQNPLGQLLEKAKQKLQRPVECVETDQACIDKARRAGAPVKIVPAPPARAPVAAAAAPPPATAATGEFSGPVPTYQAMFKLLMAAHGDVLATDDLAAWDYYLIARVPPNPTPYNFSPECSALVKRLGNEITAATLRAEAVADFKAALAQSSSAPRTGRFFLRTWEHFGPYDAVRGAFPLETINSTLLGAGRMAVPRTPQGLISPEQSRQGAGSGTYCFPGQRSETARLVSLGFELELHGHEALKEFPMERAAAEAFVNANGDRQVALEVVLETEPIQLSSGKPVVRARITAARVLDRNTGRVLNTFTGLTPTATTMTSTVPRATSAAVAYSGNRGLLLTLRDHPELATQDALLDATRSQIGAEQQTWKNMFWVLREVDLFSKHTYSGSHRWNPKRPTFFYEWQSVIDQQPDLARGPLLDVFLRTDADWSFVTRDPAWDARFDAVVSVFLFSRDKIEGREPSFAAQELLPVYKRHLDMAIAKAPTQFWFSVPLGFNYDFASKSLRLSGGMARRADRPDDTDLVAPIPSEPEVALPEGARGRAVYGIGSGPTGQRVDTRSVPPGLAINPPSASDSWRGFATIGSSWRKIPLPAIVALDRRLKVDSIPMEPARAEQLVKAQTASPGSIRLSALVYFDAERVDIGSTAIDRQRQPAAVLLAKVQKIEIVDSGNQVLATIEGSALPAPVTPASTPPPAAKAPVKTGPTPAEIETERRRKLDEQEAERSRQISERLNQQVQKPVKCAAEASKVNGNTLSKAYQDAFAACMAK
jgi:hypothetical protein